jgi:hypothetical protein
MGYQNILLAGDAVAVATSDTAQVDFIGLFVGGAGNLTITTTAGNDVTFTGVLAGTQFPHLGVTRVKATGTTCTNIVGLKR